MESTEKKTIIETAEEQPIAQQIDDNKATIDYFSMEQSDLINLLTNVVERAKTEDVKSEVEAIKVAFYKKHKSNVERQKKEFVEQGNDEADFVSTTDDTEPIFKDLLLEYKKIKAAQKLIKEQQMAENLTKKQTIVDKLNVLIDSNADISQMLPEFRTLTQSWQTIGKVVPEMANELWKNYNLVQEKFYDLIKINNELREYDFKKNLEQKTLLCEKAEALVAEDNIILAFKQLQDLHEEWKSIGPVERDLRESIWERFKSASAVINKKYQQHFESIKAQEIENLKQKTALCEMVETIDYTTFVSFKDWENAANQVVEIQNNWRNIGFAPRKDNVKIYERFRTACDIFFGKKSQFIKAMKADFSNNLKLKEALCEQVEALKESEDWQETAKKIADLQKKWKTIGQVQRKYSDAIWKRFSQACDDFFARRNEVQKSRKENEKNNLEAKKALIEQLKAFTFTGDDVVDAATLQAIEKSWHKIGHIPFKVKDEIYADFRTLYTTLLSKLKKVENSKNNFANMTRQQLIRQYNTITNELKTYENNMGFFATSKKANKLIVGLQQKIERRKQEINEIVKRLNELNDQ